MKRFTLFGLITFGFFLGFELGSFKLAVLALFSMMANMGIAGIFVPIFLGACLILADFGFIGHRWSIVDPGWEKLSRWIIIAGWFFIATVNSMLAGWAIVLGLSAAGQDYQILALIGAIGTWFIRLGLVACLTIYGPRIVSGIVREWSLNEDQHSADRPNADETGTFNFPPS